MSAAAALVAGFILGALPFSVWIARAHGVNLREQGSGNLGATNVYRVIGWKQGLLALVLDASKGTAAVLLARFLAGDSSGLVPALAGLAAVAGHMFTPFAGFKGGKGVATGLGIFLGLAPWPALFALFVWIAVLSYSGWVSLASGAAALFLPVFVWLYRDTRPGEEAWTLALAVLTAALVLVRHRPNWERIAAGREQAIWEKKRETPDHGAHEEHDA